MRYALQSRGLITARSCRTTCVSQRSNFSKKLKKVEPLPLLLGKKVDLFYVPRYATNSTGIQRIGVNKETGNRLLWRYEGNKLTAEQRGRIGLCCRMKGRDGPPTGG